MVRALVAMVTLVLGPAVADARMMEHFDLTGLVMRADTIVIADRTAAAKGPSHYHVVKVLRGKADANLDLDDSLYEMPAKADARVVVFLTHRDGQAWILPSGLRVSEGGKMFRFEQWNNPGGWAKVPQGTDPVDQWQGPTPQLDAAGLEAAIAAAIKRVDALAAARAEPDPAKRRAKLVALLPAAGVASARSGFYVDALAAEIETTLATAGDLEGALLAETHDHTSAWLRPRYGSVADLVAYASDVAHPTDLRVIAIGAAVRNNDYFANVFAVHAMIALLADPSPEVRAAAVGAAARPAEGMSSDKAEEQKRARLATEAREAIAKLYSTETDHQVLFAIADAFDGAFRRALPSRRNAPPITAHARIEHAYINVDLVCTTKHTHTTNPKLVATQKGAAVTVHAYNVSVRCDDRSDSIGTSSDVALPPGTYDLAVEVDIGKTHVTQPIGTLVRDASGESRWTH